MKREFLCISHGSEERCEKVRRRRGKISASGIRRHRRRCIASAVEPPPVPPPTPKPLFIFTRSLLLYSMLSARCHGETSLVLFFFGRRHIPLPGFITRERLRINERLPNLSRPPNKCSSPKTGLRRATPRATLSRAREEPRRPP